VLLSDKERRPRRLICARRTVAAGLLALENAYLYESEEQADNLETIFRISHAVGSSLQSRIV